MQKNELKILIVDDDLVVRKFLSNTLGRFGVCDLAGDGSKAVKLYEDSLARGDPYTLVVMDIMMPVMDGMEATERIVGLRDGAGLLPEQSRILMLSCLDDPEYISAAQFEAGADAYLTKPVEMKLLVEALYGLGLIEGEPDHAQG